MSAISSGRCIIMPCMVSSHRGDAAWRRFHALRNTCSAPHDPSLRNVGRRIMSERCSRVVLASRPTARPTARTSAMETAPDARAGRGRGAGARRSGCRWTPTCAAGWTTPKLCQAGRDRRDMEGGAVGEVMRAGRASAGRHGRRAPSAGPRHGVPAGQAGAQARPRVAPIDRAGGAGHARLHRLVRPDRVSAGPRRARRWSSPPRPGRSARWSASSPRRGAARRRRRRRARKVRLRGRETRLRRLPRPPRA